MSIKEIDLLEVVKKCADKVLSQANGARVLNISDRQLRRLILSFRLNGVDGLVVCV